MLSMQGVQAAEVDEVMERTFGGSIPQFFAAFTRNRKLSSAEIKELQEMIDNYKEN